MINMIHYDREEIPRIKFQIPKKHLNRIFMAPKATIEYKTPAQKPGYIGEVTDAQIDAWKANNPRGIFAMVDDNEKHIGYYREPYRADINAALALANAKKPLASVEAFGELLWLGGSDVFTTDTPEWGGAADKLREKMNGVKAKLVNL